jgi:hypothetical protein
VPSTACKRLQDEIPAECLQNETPTESFKCITSTKASKQQENSAKMHQHFKTFKSISKLTACVVNCCKCLQPWSKFLQVLSTACKCLQDETHAECLQNEIPAESFKCITSTKASKKCKKLQQTQANSCVCLQTFSDWPAK